MIMSDIDLFAIAHRVLETRDACLEDPGSAQNVGAWHNAIRELGTNAVAQEILDVLQEHDLEVDRLVLALRNVRALAGSMRKSDPENSEHLLRFCASAGIVGSVLREGTGCHE